MTHQQTASPAATPSPGREPRPAARAGGRWIRRTANIVIALALATAAIYAQSWVMTPDDLDAPLTSQAAPGQTAVTGQFSARLEGFELARSIRTVTTRVDTATGKENTVKPPPIRTDHIFLIATIAATVPQKPTKLTIAQLQTRDGRFFQASDRVEQRYTLAGGYIQPGWWGKGVFVFEVPKDVLAGADITISIPSSNGIYDQIYPQRYDQLLPEVALDLNLDEAQAKRLVDQAKSVYELKAKD
ncbi:MAG TPA: hypothetical protein VIR33_04660 [Thermopolyspora sp.]